ncbi:hypothetical protein PSYG_00002 [Psychrobacter phage pOW20-A]|uniref:hypothetical protein n=1 Tax=Psychrobacter phage pOW20-A TaxID=754048 RepID=UPI0002C18195|nr:hypothetical protein PSYG_00002 [Psychrobacter phage pOW20-A]AGH57463.1 hypothetical protein PSYG_00002 [Psychrobacter phage pOW20-A]
MPNNQCGLIGRYLFKFSELIDWIFPTANSVRPVEVANVGMLWSFSIIFIIGAADIILQYPYRGFTYVSSIWVWIAMFILGTGCWFALVKKSLRSDRRSAIGLALSSVVFISLSGIFASDYPPLSTAVPIYFLHGIMCLMASVKRMKTVRVIADELANEG